MSVREWTWIVFLGVAAFLFWAMGKAFNPTR